jgi:hypothetical protein
VARKLAAARDVLEPLQTADSIEWLAQRASARAPQDQSICIARQPRRVFELLVGMGAQGGLEPPHAV